jgi:hypothetical protein
MGLVLVSAEGFWRMKEVTAREGLVAILFERKYKEYSALLYFAKLYMLVGAQESSLLHSFFHSFLHALDESAKCSHRTAYDRFSSTEQYHIILFLNL